MGSKEKFESLFIKMDKNKDGIVDINELREALKTLTSEINAQELLSSADKDSDRSITVDEFLSYMKQKEQHLRVAFNEMDKNGDGKIDPLELKEAVKEMGIKISVSDAKKLLEKLDADGDMTIDFDEWREFLLLSQAQNLKQMIALMCHSSSFDLGDGIGAIPDDFSWEDIINGTVGRTILSGMVASTVSRTVTAPLERLKIFLQAELQGERSMGRIIKQMIREGGLKALWRGNGVNCIKMAPETATRSTSYWYYKSLILGNEEREIRIEERFIAGSMAGATTVTLFYPLEMIKTRMCLRKTGQYRSTIDCVRKIVVQEGGLRCLYRGYTPHVLAIIPYAGTDLALFETFKATYMRNVESERYGDPPPIYVSLAAGAASSVCGQLLTYPLALIRTQMQMSGSNTDMRLLMSNIYQSGGLFSFYRGLSANLLKAIPAVSISYAIFDQMRAFFGVKCY